MSLRLRALNFWLRHVEKARLGRLDVLAVRQRFDWQSRFLHPVRGAVCRPGRPGGVPAVFVGPAGAGPGLILWLHGGAHVMGSSRTHGRMLARLAAGAEVTACLPDFRLAPEHPYPAALDDAEAVWTALRETRDAAEIVLGGDSSGGGLMLALLARLLARGERPAGALAFAPWTDLTGASPSLATNAGADPLLPVTRYTEAVGYYLGGAEAADPGVSPLFATFPDCPPVHLQVSRTEILLDDTLRMAEHLRGAGAEVALDLWDDLPHVAAIFQGWLPEADEVLRRAAGFVRACLSRPPPRARPPAGN
jgi:acetyl esterase/lipase